MIAVYHHHHYYHHDDHQLRFVSYCKSKPKMSIIAKCSFGSCKVKLKIDSGFWSDSIVPLTSSITLFFPTLPLTHTQTHTFYSGLIVSILSTKIEINYCLFDHFYNIISMVSLSLIEIIRRFNWIVFNFFLFSNLTSSNCRNKTNGFLKWQTQWKLKSSYKEKGWMRSIHSFQFEIQWIESLYKCKYIHSYHQTKEKKNESNRKDEQELEKNNMLN